MYALKDQLGVERGRVSQIADRSDTETATGCVTTVGDSHNSKGLELQLVLQFLLLHIFRRRAHLGWRAAAQAVHELLGA